MIPEMLNGADLAFVGDAYYELQIRLYLLEKNYYLCKVIKF